MFTRNDALAADMRTLAARLDAHLVLNQSHATLAGKRFPIYRGELRFERSGHWNQKHTEEIVSIGKARCRVVYDLGVEDEPHLFALASGILTHNSKPNPMPESVKDRCTKAHEYIFLLAKSPRYYFDHEAIKEDAQHPDMRHKSSKKSAAQESAFHGNAPTNLGRCGTSKTENATGAPSGNDQALRGPLCHLPARPDSALHRAGCPLARCWGRSADQARLARWPRPRGARPY